MVVPSNADARAVVPASEPEVLVTGLDGAAGSAVGPDKALYVTESGTGTVWRVDPRTGERSLFAEGLPAAIAPIGGAFDVAFIGRTAYVLVTLVGPTIDPSSEDTVGVYRIDGPRSFTVIADIGEFVLDNPPQTSFHIPVGVQYALQTFRDGFLVTDGHHNRVLRVSVDGEVNEMIAFGNNVPTGLDVHGNRIYMAAAGPVPHLPSDGQVLMFRPRSSTAREVASGASLLVDVEFGRGRTLYALSQGDFGGGGAGSPALPGTGELLEAQRDGTFRVVAEGLDRPTSLEVIGNTGFVVTLAGEVLKIENLSPPPYGRSR